MARRFLEWPPIICFAVSAVLGLSLPPRYRFVSPTVAAVVTGLVVSLLTLSRILRRFGHPAAGRWSAGAVVAVVAFLTIRALISLLSHLAAGTPLPGWVLLHLAACIWVDNIFAFALSYWLLDRGGPDARAAGEARTAEWMFPEMVAPGRTSARWQPRFPEYLYLALTTATTFGPTDTPPLSTRARALMSVEALVSLVTIALVAARAVNILA